MQTHASVYFSYSLRLHTEAVIDRIYGFGVEFDQFKQITMFGNFRTFIFNAVPVFTFTVALVYSESKPQCHDRTSESLLKDKYL